MPDIVVPDTSCLIALECARLSVLLGNLYGRVIVPLGVRDEFADVLPEHAEVVAAQNELLVRSLRSSLGKGESEVIALALENEDAVAVLDDLRARRVARDLGVRFTGTAGILLKAKATGRLSSVALALDAMAPSGFRLSDDVRREVLRLAGEDALAERR